MMLGRIYGKGLTESRRRLQGAGAAQPIKLATSPAQMEKLLLRRGLDGRHPRFG